MSVTIHLAFSVRDEAAYEAFVDTAIAVAASRLWPVASIQVRDPKLVAELPPDRGPLRGVAVEPDGCGVPLNLLFDKGFLMETSYSTQTVGVDGHVALVHYLGFLKRHCVRFDVNDESGYWRSGDLAALRRSFREGARSMEDGEAVLGRSVGSDLRDGGVADQIIRASVGWKKRGPDEA